MTYLELDRAIRQKLAEAKSEVNVKFCGYDIETTGISPNEHRIIEVYGALFEVSGPVVNIIDTYEQRIDPQRTIQIEAQRVHGIAYSDLVGKPLWTDVARPLWSFLSRADYIIAHNGIDFDMPFTNAELVRVGWPKIEKPIIDTMVQGRWATATGKLPNLSELCFGTGIAYDSKKAHAASYDVNVMIQAFARGFYWGFIELPKIAEAA